MVYIYNVFSLQTDLTTILWLCKICLLQCVFSFWTIFKNLYCIILCVCQIGHGQPPVAFPASQADRKASSYGSQSQQQPTASQSACELCDYFIVVISWLVYSRDCPIFGGYLLLYREWVKLWTSHFACTFIGSIRTKAQSEQKPTKNLG